MTAARIRIVCMLALAAQACGCSSSGTSAESDIHKGSANSAPGSPELTHNKATVEKYLEGFRQGDHTQILSCLTEDVVWDIPGAFHLTGKEAFDKEIENEAFVGKPIITTTRLTEENDVVVAEGAVRCQKKEGDLLNLQFCDVFEMRGGRIKRLVSYLVEVK